MEPLDQSFVPNDVYSEDSVQQMASLQSAGGSQVAMLTQLLGHLMAQAFGN